MFRTDNSPPKLGGEAGAKRRRGGSEARTLKIARVEPPRESSLRFGLAAPPNLGGEFSARNASTQSIKSETAVPSTRPEDASDLGGQSTRAVTTLGECLPIKLNGTA